MNQWFTGGALPAGYGEANEANEDATVPVELLQASEVLSTFMASRGNSPEELAARIENLRAMQGKIPGMKLFYANQINKLEARRAAALRDRGATDQWRTLGQAAAGVGIILGAATIGFVLSRARRQR